MTEARALEAGAAGLDILGFVARFAPTVFLVALMAGFASSEQRFLSPINIST